MISRGSLEGSPARKSSQEVQPDTRTRAHTKEGHFLSRKTAWASSPEQRVYRQRSTWDKLACRSENKAREYYNINIIMIQIIHNSFLIIVNLDSKLKDIFNNYWELLNSASWVDSELYHNLLEFYQKNSCFNFFQNFEFFNFFSNFGNILIDTDIRQLSSISRNSDKFLWKMIQINFRRKIAKILQNLETWAWC